MALPKDSTRAVRVPREPDPGNPPRSDYGFGRLGRSALKWHHEDPKGGCRATDNTPKISAPWWQGVPGSSSCTVVSLQEDGLTPHLGLPSDTAGGGGRTLPLENQPGVLLQSFPWDSEEAGNTRGAPLLTCLLSQARPYCKRASWEAYLFKKWQ